MIRLHGVSSAALAAFLAIFMGSSSVDAATIAAWTFETNPPTTAGPISADIGAGQATSVHATPGSFTNPSGNGSAESYNSNSWAVGDYYQFQVSTLGLQDIMFFWDHTRSSSGPGFGNTSSPNFRLQYSTDGTNFTNVVDYLVPVVTWNDITADPTTKYSHDFSGQPALDNQANVYFRLTAILPSQTTSTNGQSRVDNVIVTGVVPEPAGAVLMLLALTVVAIRRN